MQITEKQRAVLEEALDCMMLGVSMQEWPACSVKYEKAIAIVREKPAGQRRVRSDFNTKRPTPQMELPSP